MNGKHSFWVVLVALLLAAPASLQAEPPAVGEVREIIGPNSAADSTNSTSSPLKFPFGVDFTADGRMLIVELEGGRVHVLSPDGKFTTIAGDGSKSYRGDGGPAKDATFNGMHNVAVSRAGKVYISDSWNHRVRQIDLRNGTIETIAGTGEAGFSGDGGPAKQAQFHDIMCVSLSPDEQQLLLTDLKNRRVRVMDLTDGTVRTIAGNGEKGVPQDGAVATESPLVDPRAAVMDSQGRVYILERGGHALRLVETDGTLRTVAGTGKRGLRDGAALEAQLNSPKHLCIDDQDRVYIADDRNGAIRRYDPASSQVSTVIGPDAGGPQLKNPHGVCFERGTLYVVDSGNHRVLRVDFRP